MKKELWVGLLAIGFIFAGVVSASAAAVTWTLVEHANYANTSPNSSNLLCAGGGGTSKCNFDTSVDCVNVGNPSVGTCSFAELSFAMASSCAAGNTGASCTSNASCGTIAHPCVPCNPPAQVGVTYFGSRTDTSKGTGTYKVDACENGFDVTAVALATSEVVTHAGGSCMTLSTFNSSTGCAVGPASMDYDIKLFTSTIGTCGFPAGIMPGLALSGRIMEADSTAAACGYTTTNLDSIASTMGLGAGDYLSVVCGGGTLPGVSSDSSPS